MLWNNMVQKERKGDRFLHKTLITDAGIAKKVRKNRKYVGKNIVHSTPDLSDFMDFMLFSPCFCGVAQFRFWEEEWGGKHWREISKRTSTVTI